MDISLIYGLVFSFNIIYVTPYSTFQPWYLYRNSLGNSHFQLSKKGDIVLQGLFPVTYDTLPCDKIRKDGLIWLMAMVYAIEEINNSEKLLPNHKLGYDIDNTCTNIPSAMKHAIRIVSKHRDNSVCRREESSCEGGFKGNRKRVSALIGPAFSWISIPVASLMGLFKIPQISYASSSRILNDKTSYRSFLRTMPSDEFQAMAMGRFVHHFQWNYVFTIASDDDYGRMGITSFKKAAKNLNVCLADDEYIPFGAENVYDRIDTVLTKLKAQPRAKVVVMFCYLEQGEMILREAERRNITDKTWLTSDAWGMNAHRLNVSVKTLSGVFTVLPRSSQIKRFENYTKRLTVATAKDNKWFLQYLEDELSCRATNSTSKQFRECGLNESLSDKQSYSFPYDDIIANVIDAVYSVAHGVHDLMTCNQSQTNTSCPLKTLPLESDALLQYILKVNFTGALGTPMSFKPNGDKTVSEYVVKNLQWEGGRGFQYVEVAYWRSSTSGDFFRVNTTAIEWVDGIRPDSTCSEVCGPGYRVVGKSQCCWGCQKCGKNSISKYRGSSTCTSCNDSYHANDARTQCIKTPVDYLKPSDSLSITIIIISIIGVIMVIVIAFICFKNRSTPLVKQTGTQFLTCFILSLTLSFTLPMFYVITKPTNSTCALLGCSITLVLTLFTAFFLAKTNAVVKLLQLVSTRLWGMRISYMQLLLVLIINITELILIIIWLTVNPQRTHLIEQEENRLLLECMTEFTPARILTLSFPLLVHFVATAISFRERNLTENFNEAKYLSFCTTALCIVVIAFVPTYMYVRGMMRILVMAFTVFVASFSCAGCIFIPKLYILLFRPHLNNPVDSKRNSEITTNSTPDQHRESVIQNDIPESPDKLTPVAQLPESLTRDISQLSAMKINLDVHGINCELCPADSMENQEDNTMVGAYANSDYDDKLSV